MNAAYHPTLVVVLLTLALLGVAVSVAMLDRQKRLRAQLRAIEGTHRDERRLRAFYEAVSSGIIVQNADGLMTFANRPACEILELPVAMAGGAPQPFPPIALLDETGRTLLPDEHPSRVARRSKRSQRGCILGARNRDGHERWLLIDAVPMIDPLTGDVGDVIISFVDVTERRGAEARLREGEDRFRTMVDCLVDGVVLQLADYSIATCNASAVRITGLTADQMLGRAPRPAGWIALRPDGTKFDLAEHPSIVALRTGRSASAMLGIRNGAEETRWIHVNTRPLFREGADVPYAALSSLADVTARVRAEEAQRAAREAAEAASRFKSEFLANTSHEIRTPMNGVLGMLELARSSTDPVEQREHVALALASAQSLLRIINDVLDFSKVEAGRLELNPHPFALADCLHSVIDPLAPRAQEKGLDLQLRVSPNVPVALVGDAVRLRQVVTNLVGNAIKFTSRGVVVVSVDLDDSVREPGTTMLHVAVRDTGIGIPGEKTVMVFDAFTQADGSTAREYGGTGLGLAISSRLVEMMGGRIWCESEIGRGSTFHFTACFGTSAAATAALEAGVARDRTSRGDIMDARTAHPCRVLLAEDNVVNQTLAVAVLEKWGHTVVVAADGRATLDAHADETFDLVLMDVQMPQIDGLEATARIRDRERATGARVPIVAMTARTMAGDRERCLAGGMDAYVSKPFDLEELFRVVESIGARRDRTRDGPVARGPARGARPDERGNRSDASSSVSQPAASIDERALLISVGGDRVLLAELVGLLRADAPRLLADIRRGIANGRPAEVALAAQALSRCFENLKASRGAAALHELETLARSDSIANAEALCVRVEREIEALFRAISVLADAA